jgi:hypothetical protein
MMVKASAIFLIALSFGSAAKAAVCGTSIKQACVTMPEPSAIPEFVVYVAGVGGYVAWRRRKRVNLKGTADTQRME